jgi:hypothetical protein
MAKLKYYVLCSSNMFTTKRHLDTIPKEDVVYVFNSNIWCDQHAEKNSQYLADAEAWAISEGIDYHITYSDGTPSTGKNSVLDIFQASDNDYMILVDGDDFITPHGIWLYDKIAQSESPPDVIALEYQLGLIPEYFAKTLFQGTDLDPNYKPSYAIRSFKQCKKWWERQVAGTGVPIDNMHPDGPEYSIALNAAQHKIYSFAYDYIDNWEPHLRVVFYSKRATTSDFRFDPELIVGEDTVQYLNLKYEWSQGNINLRHLHEIYPTYVYDQRLQGTVDFENQKNEDWGWINWMNRLGETYDELLENNKCVTDKPEYVDFPETFFPEDYIPDTLGLVSYPAKDPTY